MIWAPVFCATCLELYGAAHVPNELAGGAASIPERAIEGFKDGKGFRALSGTDSDMKPELHYDPLSQIYQLACPQCWKTLLFYFHIEGPEQEPRVRILMARFASEFGAEIERSQQIDQQVEGILEAALGPAPAEPTSTVIEDVRALDPGLLYLVWEPGEVMPQAYPANATLFFSRNALPYPFGVGPDIHWLLNADRITRIKLSNEQEFTHVAGIEARIHR